MRKKRDAPSEEPTAFEQAIADLWVGIGDSAESFTENLLNRWADDLAIFAYDVASRASSRIGRVSCRITGTSPVMTRAMG